MSHRPTRCCRKRLVRESSSLTGWFNPGMFNVSRIATQHFPMASTARRSPRHTSWLTVAASGPLERIWKALIDRFLAPFGFPLARNDC